MISKIKTLQREFAQGGCAVHGDASSPNRYVVFADGSIWFPEGAPTIVPSQALLPLLFGTFLVSGIVTAVCWADGLAWRWPLTGVSSAILLALVLVMRAEVRRSKEAEKNLESGLFLVARRIVLRDGEILEIIERDAVKQLKVRRTNRGHEKPLPWIHMILKGDPGRDVPTDLTESAFPVLEEWFKATEQNTSS